MAITSFNQPEPINSSLTNWFRSSQTVAVNFPAATPTTLMMVSETLKSVATAKLTIQTDLNAAPLAKLMPLVHVPICKKLQFQM